jgi:hypothetical protein
MNKIFTAFILFFCLSNPSFTQTNIPPGNVSGTWLKTGSPYLVTGDITIITGTTLTIQPGVVILFQGNYKFNVNGRILAIGLPVDSIYFTAQDTAIGWGGMRFISTANNGMDTSKLVYCKFTSGKAIGATTADKRGGGIYAENSNKIFIQNCMFNNNYCSFDGAALSVVFGSNVFVDKCTFTNNMSGYYGANAYIEASTAVIKNSTISNGYASFFGGGMAGWSAAVIRLENCKIQNNIAGAVCGLYTASNTVSTIVNCLFSGNVSNLGNGGGMGFSVSTATIINTTIADNTVAQGGAGIWFYNSTGTVKNSIIWGNSPDAISVTGTTPNITYSNISTTFSGTGNISTDPRFDGNGFNPYSILETSPCINTGNTDTSGLTLPLYDLAGNFRINENIIDMGAYEFTGIVPVEMISFNSHVSGNSVLLVWNTSTETNNYGFDVERSFENVWTKVGFIEGSGTSVSESRYSFTDNNVLPGKYIYRLKQIDFNGEVSYYVLKDAVDIITVNVYSLEQNYPNPFNPSTLIKFSIMQAENVKINIYDALGNELNTLVNQFMSKGQHEVRFYAGNLSSGIYFYRLTAGNFTSLKKMLLFK